MHILNDGPTSPYYFIIQRDSDLLDERVNYRTTITTSLCYSTNSTILDYEASMKSTPQTQLSDEEIDDLLYFARTGDLQALKSFSTEKNTTPSDLVNQAIGPSTGNTLLHFCAANGHMGTSPPSLYAAPSTIPPPPPPPATSIPQPPEPNPQKLYHGSSPKSLLRAPFSHTPIMRAIPRCIGQH